MIKRTGIALLVCAAGLAPALAQVATPEAGRSGADRAWSGVVDNDNIGKIVKNARISVVGIARAEPRPSAPAAKPAAAEAAPGASVSVALGIQGVCGDRPFVVPTWCPSAGAGDLYRTVRVSDAGRIDFELANRPGPWTMRGVVFNVFAVVPDSAGLDGSLGCPASAVVCQRVALGQGGRVSASLPPGRYKYYDPSEPGSGYGVLIVR